MLMVVTNDGKQKYLEYCVCVSPNPDEKCTLEIFINDFEPDDESVTADFTPATFVGYSPLTISPGDWEPIAIVDNVANVSLTTPPLFQCTGGSPQVIYGWYLRGDDTGLTYLAQRFNVPRVMANGTVEVLGPYKLKLKSFA